MSDSLIIQVTVNAGPVHAFATWTERFGTWWPRAKTVSGNPAALAFEPFVGGRIVETAPDGTEHVWGQVLAWDPPRLVRFSWHLFFDPTDATEVELTFTPEGDATVVRLHQSGFERLGAAGEERRRRTGDAWRMLLDQYSAVV